MITTKTSVALIDHDGIAVYGYGDTSAEARTMALDSLGQHATDDDLENLIEVNCTPAARAYMTEHGGAPSDELTISTRLEIVMLRSEE